MNSGLNCVLRSKLVTCIPPPKHPILKANTQVKFESEVKLRIVLRLPLPPLPLLPHLRVRDGSSAGKELPIQPMEQSKPYKAKGGNEFRMKYSEVK